MPKWHIFGWHILPFFNSNTSHHPENQALIRLFSVSGSFMHSAEAVNEFERKIREGRGRMRLTTFLPSSLSSFFLLLLFLLLLLLLLVSLSLSFTEGNCVAFHSNLKHCRHFDKDTGWTHKKKIPNMNKNILHKYCF